MGVPESQRLEESAYDLRTNAAVYERLYTAAAAVLRAGHSVIVDAVFGNTYEQARIEAVAKDTSVEFHGLWLTAPRAVLKSRIAQRTADASDATVAVLQKQIGAVSEPTHWSQIFGRKNCRRDTLRIEWVIGLGAKIAL